jgi:hypothetical protein
VTVTTPATCPERNAAWAATDVEALCAVLLARIQLAARHDADVPDDDELPPAVAEWYRPISDPDIDPPDGPGAWLAGQPEPPLGAAGPAVPEALPAGRLPRETGDGCGFAAGGVADTLPAGPVLAGFADDAWAAGLGRLSDDELIGVLRAARRLASWSAAMELAAVADLAVRRGVGPIAGVTAAVCPAAPDTTAAAVNPAAEHIGDELAAALTLTGRAADALLDLALAMDRLPATLAALRSGRIDRYQAGVIADEVSGLGAGHSAAVERQILARAPGQTTGQLRAATRRAVQMADPAAARQRRQHAERDARVERWDEHAGTAALAGRDLPPAEVLAADHNLSAIARSLRRAGADGTMDQLRAKVYLALLSGQSPASLYPAASAYSPRDAGPGPNQGSGANPGGSVNLTMPLATWLGLAELPGVAAGYGPVDAGASRQLASLLAGQPGIRWCITVTGRQGQAIAHGCARAAPDGYLNWPDGSLDWLSGISIHRLETGECSHLRESPHYRPPPWLQHLVRIRQATCSFPGCRRPATRCDYDHTIPHDQGGRTCECNLAPRRRT